MDERKNHYEGIPLAQYENNKNLKSCKSLKSQRSCLVVFIVLLTDQLSIRYIIELYIF